MSEVVAYSTFVVTMSVAISRPRIGARRIGPGAAALGGAVILLTFGIVTAADIAAASVTLWRPFVTIAAIMAMTAAARELGVLERIAEMICRRPGLTVRQLFSWIYVLSGCTASLLNNDAAVLLLTPLVLTLVKHRYPGDRQLLLPFAFAVFMAAGVAPFVVSNPMNMIVASSAGVDFNAYALRMLPIAIAGSIVAFLMLQSMFASALARPRSPAPAPAPRGLTRVHLAILVLLCAVLGSYPVVASIDPAAMWVVSLSGAVVAVALASRHDVDLAALVTRGVAWEILVFLLAVFVIAIGLRNVGVVDYLASLYQGAGVATVGIVSAIGSAVLNNHPMAIMNLLALEGAPDAQHREILAALIGGDLGPRLLPIGSLAGLLWIESCRRLGVEITVDQFVRIGAAVTVPTLAVSLLILALS
jgi:arsenical pump membrane protein